MDTVTKNSGFSKQFESRKTIRSTCKSRLVNGTTNDNELIRFPFRFHADRWLSDKKDDKKTFVDLLPGQPKPPAKGK